MAWQIASAMSSPARSPKTLNITIQRRTNYSALAALTIKFYRRRSYICTKMTKFFRKVTQSTSTGNLQFTPCERLLVRSQTDMTVDNSEPARPESHCDWAFNIRAKQKLYWKNIYC